jgi:hypothetical protein
MWFVNYSVCLFKGHDCSELTSDGKDYSYCHRCGRIKASERSTARPESPVNYTGSPRPARIAMPVDKIWR